MKKSVKKSQMIQSESTNASLVKELLSGKRRGIFEQGYDKLGRPYQKKLDDNGFYTKEEVLKDGTQKLTIKRFK